MIETTTDILVIGGGAAGLAAALEARKAGARVLLAEREDYLGGVLPQCLHHGFGLGTFGEDLTGVEYGERYTKRFLSSGADVRLSTAVIRLNEDKAALLSGSSGLETVSFRHAFLCTGCRERPLQSLWVGGTRPAGIFTAGQAQKLINLGSHDVGDNIVILGSGDIGQIMARRFSLCGKRVVAMVEIMDHLGGLARNRRECIEAYHIPVILRATAETVHGEGRITGVTLRHVDTEEREYIPCDTLITSLGLIPERELIRGETPPWLSLCGNCEHVHEIVDGVTTHAEEQFRLVWGREG